eukprot:1185251-Amorphochlora_amoeboformis.AAC.1
MEPARPRFQPSIKFQNRRGISRRSLKGFCKESPKSDSEAEKKRMEGQSIFLLNNIPPAHLPACNPPSTIAHQRKSNSALPNEFNYYQPQDLKNTLQRAGYDVEVAKAKLAEWKSLGLNTSDKVRVHLVSGAVGGVAYKALWMGIYAFFTWSLYAWSVELGEKPILLKSMVLFLTYINAFNFLQEFLLFATLVYATIQFANNPVLLDAVKEIAGDIEEPIVIPKTLTEVKPPKVVNVLQVFYQLQEVFIQLIASPANWDRPVWVYYYTH